MRGLVLAAAVAFGIGYGTEAAAADDASKTTCDQLFKDGGFDRALMWRTMEATQKRWDWPSQVQPGKAGGERVLDLDAMVQGLSEMLVRAGHDCARNPQARFLDVLEQAATAAGAKFEP